MNPSLPLISKVSLLEVADLEEVEEEEEIHVDKVKATTMVVDPINGVEFVKK